MSEKFVCYHCGAPGADPPYIDEDGIGWLACCLRCWEDGEGDAHATAQRIAKRRSDGKDES